MKEAARLRPVAEGVYAYRDSCTVYVLVSGADALLVDFGSGAVLDGLHEIGVERVRALCLTHHHRDQCSGLERAVAAGIPVHVPHYEREYFTAAEAYWDAREVRDNYLTRQDRRTRFDSVPVAGTLEDYATVTFGPFELDVVPTPGHTPGSISLRARAAGGDLLFCGDLLAGPGRLASLAATQWTYNGGEGLAATELSLLDLLDDPPAMMLPSHGEPFSEVESGLRALSDRLLALMRLRKQNPRLLLFRDEPYEEVVPGLLRNRTSTAYHYVLVSESGDALFLDFGYDFMTGFAGGTGPDSRRPWLATIPRLKERYGVKRIDAVLLTHYHDDHVAGCNVLRRVEGARVWSPALFADVLERPERYDLPCLWYEPIAVDRRIPLDETVRWREYELRLVHQPGHTHYAVAISFEAGGKRVLAIGDQWQGGEADLPNYVYENVFAANDYLESARRYRELDPEILVSGHWDPYEVEPGYFDRIEEKGRRLFELHTEILGLEPGTAPRAVGERRARLEPYRCNAAHGERIRLVARLDNPAAVSVIMRATPVVPDGWRAEPESVTLELAAGATGAAEFEIAVPQAASGGAGATAGGRGGAVGDGGKGDEGVNTPRQRRRYLVGLDLEANDEPLGVVAEAIVELTNEAKGERTNG